MTGYGRLENSEGSPSQHVRLFQLRMMKTEKKTRLARD